MVASPLPLGPFLVGEGGKLLLRRPDSEPAFSFLWRGRCFSVRMRAGTTRWSVPIGRLPSTSAGVARREAATLFFRALSRALPPGWRLRLLPDHRVQLDTEQGMEWPTTAGALLVPIVRILLRAAPLMDLLDENGLA